MTNTSGTPAGWYYAPGDPDGTHRYWDGAQWIGGPQPIPQPAAPPAAQAPPTDDMTVQYRPPAQESAPFDAPSAHATVAPDYSNAGSPSAGGAPPNYGVPGAPGAAPGFEGFGAAQTGPGTPAEWGVRAVALLIDWGIGLGIAVVGGILAGIGFAIADAIGILLVVVLIGVYLAYFIWNFCVRQGTTGQTIGKEKKGIRLVKDDTGQPVGSGMAFVRYLLAGIIGGFCGIYTILDYLWPLWDVDNKRLTDKMVTMSVVTV